MEESERQHLQRFLAHQPSTHEKYYVKHHKEVCKRMRIFIRGEERELSEGELEPQEEPKVTEDYKTNTPTKGSR